MRGSAIYMPNALTHVRDEEIGHGISLRTPRVGDPKVNEIAEKTAATHSGRGFKILNP